MNISCAKQNFKGFGAILSNSIFFIEKSYFSSFSVIFETSINLKGDDLNKKEKLLRGSVSLVKFG